MSKFIYHIYYGPAIKMDKPDSLSWHLGQEKSGMNNNFFDEWQLLDHNNDDVGDEEDVEDVELEGIDVATSQNKNGLWVVPQEYRLEVLRKHHDSQVAGH